MNVNLQLGTTIAYSIISGVLLFLMEWAGWRGRFAVWGDPRPLNEIWWHLPELVALVFVVMIAFRIIHRLLGGSGELP